MKTITIGTEQEEEARDTSGFVSVSRYANLVPVPREIGSIFDVRILSGVSPRPAHLVKRQQEIASMVRQHRTEGTDLLSLQAQCAIIGHQVNLRHLRTCVYCEAEIDD